MGEKIFCKDCKHYLDLSISDNWLIYIPVKRCFHPENIVDTWLSPKSAYSSYPLEINKNNDCPWFEQKPIEPVLPEPPAKLSRKNLLRKIFGRK